MRDPYLTRLSAPPALRPLSPSERVREALYGAVVAVAVLVLLALAIAAFSAVGLTTPRGLVALSFVVLAAAVGGFAWRTR